VVIFLLLVSSGVGSQFSGRFGLDRLRRAMRTATVGIASLTIAYAVLIDRVIQHSQPFPAVWKILIVGIVIVPLGFLMGIPFPSTLRLSTDSSFVSIEWIWAVNAAATVFGSVLAIFLAVLLGITKVMLIGGVTYVAAALLVASMRTEDQVFTARSSISSPGLMN
jgi:hypothetical protein